MKKVIEELAAKGNLLTAYSGAKRIMFVKGDKNQDFVAYVRGLYPALAFQLKAVDIFAPHFPEQNISFDHSTIEQAHALPLIEQEKVIEAEIRAEESEEEKKLRIRAELDIYLIENPIDKSKKGFFVPIAEKFSVTSDYVRKRYNSLKERGLLKEIVNS